MIKTPLERVFPFDELEDTSSVADEVTIGREFVVAVKLNPAICRVLMCRFIMMLTSATGDSCKAWLLHYNMDNTFQQLPWIPKGNSHVCIIMVLR